jgi:hypothetical protein
MSHTGLLDHHRLTCSEKEPLGDIGAAGIRDRLGLRHSRDALLVMLTHPDREPDSGLCRWCGAGPDSLNPVF